MVLLYIKDLLSTQLMSVCWCLDISVVTLDQHFPVQAWASVDWRFVV